MNMNTRKYITKILSSIISVSILMQNGIIFAQKTNNKIRIINVGYLGEKSQNIPSNTNDFLRQKILGALNQNFFEFYDSYALQKNNKLEISSMPSNQDSLKNYLGDIANKANLDYLFISYFENIANDNERIMLKGKVMRYNQASSDIYNHEILSYVEDLDMHMKALKNELVDSIPHSVYGMKKNRNYLLIGVLLVVGLALNQSFSDLGKYLNPGSSGDGSSDPGGIN